MNQDSNLDSLRVICSFWII